MLRSKKNKKVYVGMSGGVDSSVSAYLLKKSGHDVTGVFIKVWQPAGVECTWKQDRLDAMRVAAELEIPFVTLDLEQEYKSGVIDYMLAEYKLGRVPNPDVMCNKTVKFGAFYTWARTQGADYVATGHYCQNIWNESQQVFEMQVSKDISKDQGYFLWTLTADVLSHTLFPIGHMTKDEVRALAKKANLYTQNKKDSQGLCFIGQIDFKNFLKEHIAEKAGQVLNERAEVVGHHSGVTFLTIGERHGFTIDLKTDHDMPLYIYKKDIEKNLVYVTDKPAVVSRQNKSLQVTSTNWINRMPVVGEMYTIRLRHGGNLIPAKCIEITHGRARFELEEGDSSINPGQSAVVLDGRVLLGGGIIS